MRRVRLGDHFDFDYGLVCNVVKLNEAFQCRSLCEPWLNEFERMRITVNSTTYELAPTLVRFAAIKYVSALQCRRSTVLLTSARQVSLPLKVGVASQVGSIRLRSGQELDAFRGACLIWRMKLILNR